MNLELVRHVILPAIGIVGGFSVAPFIRGYWANRSKRIEVQDDSHRWMAQLAIKGEQDWAAQREQRLGKLEDKLIVADAELSAAHDRIFALREMVAKLRLIVIDLRGIVHRYQERAGETPMQFPELPHEDDAK